MQVLLVGIGKKALETIGNLKNIHVIFMSEILNLSNWSERRENVEVHERQQLSEFTHTQTQTNKTHT